MSRRFLRPYPLEPGTSTNQLQVSGKIETPTGWLDLDDGIAYEFEATAFGERGVTWRKQEVTSPFIEGTFVTGAVRENVLEQVNVYVRGESHSQLAQRVKRLTDAFGQLSYRMMLRFDDVARYWDCQPADYTVVTQREFVHARMALVRAQVPRLPAEEIVLATGDEL